MELRITNVWSVLICQFLWSSPDNEGDVFVRIFNVRFLILVVNPPRRLTWAPDKLEIYCVTSYIYIGLVLGCIDADLCKYFFLKSAFFQIYKMCILLHRSNLSNFANFRQHFWWFFRHISQHFGISCVSPHICCFSNIFWWHLRRVLRNFETFRIKL